MLINDVNNNYFIDQLKTKLDEDVILFCIDGMSYYGHLDEINNKNIATLSPATLASSELVEIQNPAEVQAVENTLSIDLCNIVAYGFNITADPFVLPDENEEDVIDDEINENEDTDSLDICGNDCHNGALINKLNDMKKTISIFTYGGFLFAGRLTAQQNKTASLKTDFVFAPGGDGSTLFSINRIMVNLKAATAVAS